MSATLASPASPESALVRLARKIADEELAKIMPPIMARIKELEAEVAETRELFAAFEREVSKGKRK